MEELQTICSIIMRKSKKTELWDPDYIKQTPFSDFDTKRQLENLLIENDDPQIQRLANFIYYKVATFTPDTGLTQLKEPKLITTMGELENER